MASTTTTSNGIDHREIALLDAIQRKRLQLDDEIETFKALKEHEFRAFSTKLRKSSGDVDDEIGRVETSLKGIRARIKVGNKGAKEKKGHEKGREREFEGVFTPKFLPLLGSKGALEEAKEQDRGDDTGEALINYLTGLGFHRMRLEADKGRKLTDKEEKALKRAEEERLNNRKEGHVNEEANRDEVERTAGAAMDFQEVINQATKDLAAARRGAQSLLSSSAEYRRSGLISPPATPARPLSSSVPAEHAHDQRRLSSKSDGSIDGLRSSLKNSKEPKSPKRVQFSIDDTVVSPSTSPIAKRVGVPAPGDGPNQPKTSMGFDKFEVLKGQREGKTSDNGSPGGGGETSSQALAWAFNYGPDDHPCEFEGPRYDTLVSPTSAEEPFDILDHDEDVFEFDEDIGMKGSATTRNINEEPIDDNEAEPERGGTRPSLTGSSPHAGSLPIEIKWGGRRGRDFEDD